MASPQDLVWHYTDTAGLIGMATTHTLWATAVAFVNDPGERDYAERIVQEAIPDQALRAVAGLDAPVSHSGFTNRYVFCASKADDNLELWRGYGSERVSQTFAVGLDPSAPLAVLAPGMAGRDRPRVTPWQAVNYVSAEQAVADLRADFVPWYEQFDTSWREAHAAERGEGDMSERTLDHLIALSTRIDAERSAMTSTTKHPAYRAEQEVRVSVEIDDAAYGPGSWHKVRQGATGPVPYIELTGVADPATGWDVVATAARLPIGAVITPPGAGLATIHGVCAALEAGGHAHDHQDRAFAVTAVQDDPETGTPVPVYGRRVTIRQSEIPFV